MGSVYLLHFHPRFKHARHYVGYADQVKRRIRRHRAGQGATITRAAVQRGHELLVVKLWRGADRTFERKIKTQSRSRLAEICPVCAVMLISAVLHLRKQLCQKEIQPNQSSMPDGMPGRDQ